MDMKQSYLILLEKEDVSDVISFLTKKNSKNGWKKQMNDEKELREFTDQAAIALHKKMLEEEEEDEFDNEVHRLYKVELYIWDYGGEIEHDEKEHGLDSVMIHIDQQLDKYFTAEPQLHGYQTKDFKNKVLNKQGIDYKKIWDEEDD